MAELVWRLRGHHPTGGVTTNSDATANPDGATSSDATTNSDATTTTPTSAEDRSTQHTFAPKKTVLTMADLAATSRKMLQYQAQKAKIVTKYWKNLVLLLVDQEQEDDPGSPQDNDPDLNQETARNQEKINEPGERGQKTHRKSRIQRVMTENYGRRDLWPFPSRE
jgi:hypothetical protein